jgi:P4 family phage/plasmid primase-like protien
MTDSGNPTATEINPSEAPETSPFDVDMREIVHAPEEWIERICNLVDRKGFWKLETDDALDYLAELQADHRAIWKRTARQIRSHCNGNRDLPKVSEVDGWKSDVVDRAAEESTGLTFDRGDAVELSEVLQGEIEGTAGGDLVYDRGRFWRFNRKRGTWKTIAREELKRTVKRFAGCPVYSGGDPSPLKLSGRKVGEAVDLLRVEVDESAHGTDDTGFFDDATAGLTFDNARVEADIDHSDISINAPTPEDRSRLGVDVELPTSTPPAPKFEQYLKDIFDGDPDADAKRDLLLEFAGGALLGLGPVFQKALVLYDNTARSQGRNGKSVMVKILSELLPSHATAQLSPQDLDRRFATAQLEGARLNFAAELPEQDILASGTLKGVIAGDPQRAERKNQDPFQFRPQASHLFAANKLPTVKATDDAFWRRWIVLPFNNTFTGNDAIPNLEQTILDEEKAGVLARLVEGAGRLLRRGGYDLPNEVTQAKRNWRIESNQLEQFLIDECENYTESGPIYDTDHDNDWHLEDDRSESAGAMFEAYKGWSGATNHGGLNSTNFGRRLKKLIDKKKTSNGYRYRIRLKPTPERREETTTVI